jgi:hypothetical protein
MLTAPAQLEFKVRLVEGDVDWCSNPRAFVRYEELRGDYQAQKHQPGYTSRRFGSERQHREISLPGATITLFYLRNYMDFEQHDGANVEVYRVVISEQKK